MKVCVGPVAPNSAEAWIGWARKTIGELRREPGPAVELPAQVLDHVSSYVESWAGATQGDVFHWQVDVDPDQVEYLANGLYNLDRRLADEGRETPGPEAPAEARAFHLTLVQALLVALAQDGPSRAAFVEQLRPSWPVAADAR